jgi:hypothetical protein
VYQVRNFLLRLTFNFPPNFSECLDLTDFLRFLIDQLKLYLYSAIEKMPQEKKILTKIAITILFHIQTACLLCRDILRKISNIRLEFRFDCHNRGMRDNVQHKSGKALEITHQLSDCNEI